MFVKTAMRVAAAGVLMLGAANANAAKKVPAAPSGIPTLGATNCSLLNITPAATACKGWYVGNLNNNGQDNPEQSAYALNQLLGINTYTAANVGGLESLPSIGGTSINFARALFGDTVISFHVGGANGQTNGIGYSGTAFFLFNAGNMPGGLDTIGVNVGGLSNARLYSTGAYTPPVPEPTTWAMMIVGAGAIGGTMRRRRSTKLALQAA